LQTTDARPATLARHPWEMLRAEVSLRSRSAFDESVVLIHREATPVSRGGVERRIMSKAGRAVYDLDDALYAKSGTMLRTLLRPESKYSSIATQADLVIAGNDYLADWAERHCRSVVTIPTCVEPSDYVQKTDYRVGDPPVLGWVGSFSTLLYLEALAVPLRQLHRENGTRLEVIGTGAPLPAALSPLGVSIRWSPAEVMKRLATWDVGLMPLPDTQFAQGKSAYKLLQYCAAGLPSVASPVGMNAGVLLKIGAPGPTNEAEWLESLRWLTTTSEDERRRLGRRARDVATSYSYDAWSHEWQRAVLG